MDLIASRHVGDRRLSCGFFAAWIFGARKFRSPYSLVNGSSPIWSAAGSGFVPSHPFASPMHSTKEPFNSNHFQENTRELQTLPAAQRRRRPPDSGPRSLLAHQPQRFGNPSRRWCSLLGAQQLHHFRSATPGRAFRLGPGVPPATRWRHRPAAPTAISPPSSNWQGSRRLFQPHQPPTTLASLRRRRGVSLRGRRGRYQAL